MEKRKTLQIGLMLLFGLLLLNPLLNARGDIHQCPNDHGYNAKILEVTTVNQTTLETIFGTSWALALDSNFGGNASVMGVKSKFIIQEINGTQQIDYSAYAAYGLGYVQVCRLTMDRWHFTTGEFIGADKLTTDIYIMKDPSNLSAYVQGYRAL